MRAVLSDTELAAKRLELEITEGVLLSNDDHVHDMIGNLKAIGVKLALDDFGTGYSSSSYLLRVPFDKIKIDRSFVCGASDPESRNAALIRAMVGLASDLNMQTTAEGVETQDELLLIRNLGCSLVQGYIFGKPMSAEEALELAAKGAGDVPTGSSGRAKRESGPSAPRCFITAAGHRRAAAQYLERRRAGRMPPAGPRRDEIQLDFAVGGLIGAKIVWTKGTQFGVQFNEKFDLKLLQPAKAARSRQR